MADAATVAFLPFQLRVVFLEGFEYFSSVCMYLALFILDFLDRSIGCAGLQNF
jgi:hypothetical protein